LCSKTFAVETEDAFNPHLADALHPEGGERHDLLLADGSVDLEPVSSV
jgi:hypothetical protein